MNPTRRTPLAGLGLVLAGVIALPTSTAMAFDTSGLEGQAAALIARKGGGGGGGGGARKAGGHSGFSNSGGGLNRGSAKPSGGWSNKARVGGGGTGGGPSLNRPAPAARPAAGNRATTGTRPGGAIGSGDRMANRDINRNVNRDVNRDVNRNVNRNVNRSWNRSVNVNRANLYPGWARPGWGVARPWNHGWYGGWGTPAWSWWGARAAAWGVTTLATAAIINNAVDDAINAHNTYIVVPNTNYQLLYGTVQPSGSDSVSFVVQANGTDYQLNANCNQGTINGQEPSNAEEAQLLNAACQVAFGTV